MPDLFKEIVPSILQTKKPVIQDDADAKDYVPFVVNRALSQHKDCVAYANEMNSRHYLDKKVQFDFLLNTVRSMKRPFAKWAKTEKNDDLECVKLVYGLSDSKARDALRLLSKEEIQKIKEQTYTGGLGK